MQKSIEFRILIVENNPKFMIAIKELIKVNLNCKITFVSNGEEAKKLLQVDQNFNVVLSDFNMPIVNGIELFEFLLKENINIPFILLSTENLDSFRSFEEIKNFYILSKFKLFTDLIPLVLKINTEFIS